MAAASPIAGPSWFGLPRWSWCVRLPPSSWCGPAADALTAPCGVMGAAALTERFKTRQEASLTRGFFVAGHDIGANFETTPKIE